MSYCFRLVCLLHSGIAMISGVIILFDFNDKTHAKSKRFMGSTLHDQLLIRTNEALTGLLFFAIGLLLFIVSFVRDTDFHCFFAKGCVLVYGLIAGWRLWFQRRIADFSLEWPRQLIGDLFLGLSWVFFLVWKWREKYD
ncbi:hypothetical protein KP509_13G022100 [Ceratopteris richardii]|nr:hypothetical protein KP509_13G022100 [Ceratopteris richardii]